MKVDPYSGLSTSFILFTLKICIFSSKKLEYQKKLESIWSIFLNRLKWLYQTTYVFKMDINQYFDSAIIQHESFS